MVFILAGIADVMFAVLKGVALVAIGTVYTVMEWFRPH